MPPEQRNAMRLDDDNARAVAGIRHQSQEKVRRKWRSPFILSTRLIRSTGKTEIELVFECGVGQREAVILCRRQEGPYRQWHAEALTPDPYLYVRLEREAYREVARAELAGHVATVLREEESP